MSVFENIHQCIIDGGDRDIKNTYTISGFQRTEVQLVYRTELHVAVNEYPEKFLKSCVFYFLRNAKGEITLTVKCL